MAKPRAIYFGIPPTDCYPHYRCSACECAFSLAAVYVDRIGRRCCAHGGKTDCGEEFYLDALKMAIAALRERDILFEQVRGYCHTCKKNKTDFDCHAKCYGHQRGSAWEWDGGRRQEEV